MSKINFVHDIKVEINELDEFTISKLEESTELYISNPTSFKSWEEVKAEILNEKLCQSFLNSLKLIRWLFCWKFGHIHVENFPSMTVKIFNGALLHKTIIFHFTRFYPTCF